MKRVILLFLGWSAACFAVDRFQVGPADIQATGMNAQRLAAIPVRMKAFVDAGKTAGVVTLLARHGRIASFEAVGYQDLETRKLMRKDTMFRIASLTKPITCAAVMVLVDEGRLAVIDPVEKYLPEYKALKLNPCGARLGYNCELTAPSRPMNIEDLMTHTSGLPPSAEPGNAPAASSLAELVTAGAKTHLLFEPGAQWSYSNIGFDILGRIIEVVSGQSFDRFLSERIFEPLGMNDTYFFVPAEAAAHRRPLRIS
jgi:CubicO group peptidase (beta-lactamase class C family)